MTKHSLKLKSSPWVLLALVCVLSCAETGQASNTKKNKDSYTVKSVQRGEASWYSVKTNFGTETASGERLTDNGATAAHKTLPMGTKVRVTNLINNKSEIVRINDRGPFVKGRIIDVSIGTAEKLGFAKRGVAPIKVEVIEKKGS